MKFAEYYFNSNDARGVGFRSWLQQALYSALMSTPLKPDWDQIDRRVGLRKTVNKVLDIFYLHKRIAFLESALTLVLERHQLKGLHLVHNVTREESDKKYKDYQLRDRVVMYLSKYISTSTFGSLAGGNELRSEGKDSDL